MRFLIALVSCLVLVACNNHVCRNPDSSLAKGDFRSPEYQRELVDQLNKYKNQEFSYTYDAYEKVGNKEAIFVDVYSDSVCAKARLVVNDWTKLAGVRRVVSGYRGAEMRGLKFDIADSVLVFRDVDALID